MVLVFEEADMDKPGAIINDPKYKSIKNKHTVLEPIIISMQLIL
ncbi:MULTISPECIES: hypothetical protein [Arenibacter]|nr:MULTISPECIES: hypothetical protein [Arenibacter]